MVASFNRCWMCQNHYALCKAQKLCFLENRTNKPLFTEHIKHLIIVSSQKRPFAVKYRLHVNDTVSTGIKIVWASWNCIISSTSHFGNASFCEFETSIYVTAILLYFAAYNKYHCIAEPWFHYKSTCASALQTWYGSKESLRNRPHWLSVYSLSR